MKAVIQRVCQASVEVDGTTVGRISRGLLILLAVERDDRREDAEYLATKIINLRIFGDDRGNLNCSVQQIGGELLVISQFTLAGNTRKGRRPSFDRAAAAPQARELYESFVEIARETGLVVEEGVFGAMMKVHLVNDGPVTFIVECRR